MRQTVGAPLWLVALSILLALALTVVPLPAGAVPYRPEWVAMTLAYWCLRTPGRIGPAAAWISGLALDALNGALLGQHALALTLVAFLTLKFQLRIRVFPLLQQTLTVAAIIALHEFVLLWIDGIVGEAVGGVSRWTPSLMTLVVWPLAAPIMDRIRARAAG